MFERTSVKVFFMETYDGEFGGNCRGRGVRAGGDGCWRWFGVSGGCLEVGRKVVMELHGWKW